MGRKQRMPPLRSYRTIWTYACSVPGYGPRKQASGNAALRWKCGTKGENINTNYKKRMQNAMPSVLEKTILNEPVAFSVTVLAAVVLFIFSFPWTIETPIKLRLTVTRWGIEEFCNPHSLWEWGASGTSWLICCFTALRTTIGNYVLSIACFSWHLQHLTCSNLIMQCVDLRN